MKRTELIKKYIEFFKSKDHKEIQNSSLIPENDPTVLFTTAGMHPLVPFLLGQPHPQGKRLVNVQRCIRTVDIEEVGDETHHTFFEMFGNWSLGDYWKEKSIKDYFEFLTKSLNVPLQKLAIGLFKGDKDALKDLESEKTWMKLGIVKERIYFGGREDNWWGPAGETGPCGPCIEIFYWSSNQKVPKEYDPKNKNWVEIGTTVLMDSNKTKDGTFIPLNQKNIDFGGGFERTLTMLNNLTDNYLTEIWQPLIKRIEQLSNKKYEDNKKEMRIIADHIKAACFIIHDGIVPGNSEQGYVLRRLIRRAIRNLRKLDVDILEINTTDEIAKEVFKIYPDYNLNEKLILTELKKEEDKFQKTLDKGLKEFEKMSKDKKIDGKESFLLYQSYGFPLEMIEELSKEGKIKFNSEDFKKELRKHQELSQTASAGKFKSGLADNSEATTKLHTAAHLLHKAIRVVLKDSSIMQKGSNINPERLRFDYSFDRKLTSEEKTEIENMVNKKIKESLPITREEMSPQEAKEKGAVGVFDKKYGNKISMYSIGDFSKEICTGPHVENTKELGKFKIIKEQSSSSGVRRIKAVLE
ncbi:alanine--tRNA ligase [archaeon]|jgi:alanyl-tRNA synthetase|nr:alanine--tRNA ligase [archaeon]